PSSTWEAAGRVTVSERIVAQLAAAGVRRAYTVPGESFLPLLDACDRHPDIALISTRHESGAAFMAEADAKVTGRPALAMATRGVGAANLSIGVHTAYQDSTPMVVILGQVESAFLGREAFQEVDLPSFYREITKWAVTAPSSERLPELVGRAIHVATSGRPGPVMVAVPADLFEGDAGPEQSHLPGVVDRGRAAPSGRTSERIAEVLRDADAPVMIVGGGGRDARDALVTAAERFGLGVYASFRRQDVFPNDHPNYCGPLVLTTPPETLRALEEADVVFVVGCRLSEITTQGYRLPRADQRVIQIDVEPNSVGAVVPVELGLVADVREALAAILHHAPDPPADRDWTAAHGAFLAASTLPEATDGPLHPAAVIATLAEVFPPTVVLVNDAGNFSIFAHRYWRFSHPRTQIGPTSGAMGYGVPGGIGAKLADPSSEVVVLAGDGGFLMTGQELETAVRHDVPFTTVVFRNGLYGTIALHQARAYGRKVGVDIGDVDIAAVARGYGAEAWSVSGADELTGALTRARACGRPAVIDCRVDPDVLSPSDRLSTLLADG
ncbi:MAG TPA: thiamine pyrophosphate-dependent enzyme, partial [Actinomycetota bacterium]|nr:thiamine pyrophosphate-dependent enzyme [Actinomycetota bacterium]